jgi:hypothetical protein
MNELFPFVGGLLAGIFTSWLPRRQTRCVWSIAIGTVVGGVATLASGEYRFGWHFVLIDTVLAIGTALSVSTHASDRGKESRFAGQLPGEQRHMELHCRTGPTP